MDIFIGIKLSKYGKYYGSRNNFAKINYSKMNVNYKHNFKMPQDYKSSGAGKADLTEWNRWFMKFVKPVYIPTERENYYEKIKQLQTPFYPKYWIAEKFYDKLKNDDRFDEELKMFFSFLYSCGFFMDYIISFEEWLQMNNWENPNSEATEQTILKILNMPNGIELLKQKLRWIPYLNRIDGN